MTTLTGDEFLALGHDSPGLRDWQPLLRRLKARYRTGDFATGLALVNQIAAAAEEADHHPDLDLRYTHLNIRLFSHDADGITDRDVALATRISGLAAAAGVEADPDAVQSLELALDTADWTAIKPFWSAVLGLPDADLDAAELVDGEGDLPPLWFQETDPHDEPRMRFHVDVTVPAHVAERRIAAALAAGGVLVSDEAAPRFTVLADAEGNKACICTCVGRGA